MTGDDAPRVHPYVGKAVIFTPGRVLAALGLGPLLYGWLWATDPTALTTQTTATLPPPRRGEQSVWAAADHKPAPW